MLQWIPDSPQRPPLFAVWFTKPWVVFPENRVGKSKQWGKRGMLDVVKVRARAVSEVLKLQESGARVLGEEAECEVLAGRERS
jgi:hypothetical protein